MIVYREDYVLGFDENEEDWFAPEIDWFLCQQDTKRFMISLLNEI